MNCHFSSGGHYHVLLASVLQLCGICLTFSEFLRWLCVGATVFVPLRLYCYNFSELLCLETERILLAKRELGTLLIPVYWVSFSQPVI